jgi:DNA-binding FadR family transcriptional regulator
VSSASSHSLHRRIVNGLGRQILSGKLRPGEPLPTPVGVHASRTAIREAIKVLTAKGLVEARPRVGTRVRARSAWQLLDPDVISWQHDGPLSADFLRHLTEVREVLEPAAAAMAARRARSEDIDVIERAYQDMMHATAGRRIQLGRFVAADRRFHAAIVAASGNALLEQVGQTVFTALGASFHSLNTRPGAARASMPRHRAILDAIRKGRPAEARSAMRRLIGHTAREMKKDA